LLDQLSAKQINEWEAYDKLDPIGTWRADYRMAALSSLIMNGMIAWSGDKEEKKPTVPLDFMPDWGGDNEKEAPQQSVEDQKRVLRALVSGQKKRLEREKDLEETSKRTPIKLKKK